MRREDRAELRNPKKLVIVMPDYTVYIQNTVSTAVRVTADTPELAATMIDESPDMPGAITHGAFGGGVTVDEAGEWEAFTVVADVGDTELWTRPDLNAAVAALLRSWPPATLEQANELVAQLEKTWEATWT